MRVGILLAALALTVGNMPRASAAADTATKHKPPSILLVGASGMIGSRILKEAVARGHYVIAASRHPEKIASGPGIHPVKLDATDREAFIAEARHADVIVLATSPRGGGDPLAEAKAGKEAAVEKFLAGALPLANQEAATPVWFALRLGPSTFGIFEDRKSVV